MGISSRNILNKKGSSRERGIADEGTFRELFAQLFRPLLLYARKFVDNDTAADMVQEAFYQLWLNRDHLTIHSSIKAYLFAIVRNKCYHELHKKSLPTTENLSNDLILEKLEFDYFENVDSILVFDMADALKKALEKLPPKCREVFLMNRETGLSYREIATKLDLSEKMIEKHISKALAILRSEMAEFLPLVLLLLEAAENNFY